MKRTRADFAETLEALIETYNAGSRSIEQLLEELLKLSTTWMTSRSATSARISPRKSWSSSTSSPGRRPSSARTNAPGSGRWLGNC
jgi:hypothetical protein